jgi:DNA-binding MurR/RpiR family transcriptional regulator
VARARGGETAAAAAGGGAPIADYDGLVAALLARRGRLSRRHAEVARFVLNHPEEVAVNGIVRLAARAGVPPATITRFAQELGFAGFSDLQQVFRERLLGPRPAFAERVAERLARPPVAAVADADLDDPSRVFDGLVQAAMGSLLRIGEDLDRAALGQVVTALAACEAVHVAGARGAFGLAAYAVYGLARAGKRAHLIDNLGAMRAEQLAAMGPRDALLVLTFDDYTPETVEAARRAAEAGRVVLAVTDNELSPVAPIAQAVLYVKEARLGHFRSQVPALVLLQAALVSLGRRLGRGDEQPRPDRQK